MSRRWALKWEELIWNGGRTVLPLRHDIWMHGNLSKFLGYRRASQKTFPIWGPSFSKRVEVKVASESEARGSRLYSLSRVATLWSGHWGKEERVTFRDLRLIDTRDHEFVVWFNLGVFITLEKLDDWIDAGMKFDEQVWEKDKGTREMKILASEAVVWWPMGAK